MNFFCSDMFHQVDYKVQSTRLAEKSHRVGWDHISRKIATLRLRNVSFR